jgi:hypothetical protein
MAVLQRFQRCLRPRVPRAGIIRALERRRSPRYSQDKSMDTPQEPEPNTEATVGKTVEAIAEVLQEKEDL